MAKIAALGILKRKYPRQKHYLKFRGPFQLLVAAILSAQVTDERVNEATPGLFKQFKTPKDFGKANLEKIIKHIRRISFPANKARSIKKCCQALIKDHKGKVPKTMEELVKLPGIGRKTANVILSQGYNIIVGIPVDTHVIRVAYRLGWTKETKPDKIEKDLIKIIPKNDWKRLQWIMKDHGKAICKPTPHCSICPVNKLCPKKGVTKKL